MILTDLAILKAMEKGDILVEPYNRNCLGTNSYDVHLSKYLACYIDDIIDAKRHNQVEHFEIADDGIVLNQENALGSTLEVY